MQSLTINTASASEQLWRQAFSKLEKEHPELVLMLKTSSTFDNNPERLQTTIQRRLDQREAKRWAIHVAGCTFKVRESLEKIVKFAEWSKDYVAPIATKEPHAALAWAGISLLLPLLLNNNEQNDAMTAGLASIADLIPLYKVREDLYISANSNNKLEEYVVDLYAAVLAFQSRALQHLSRKTIDRGARNLIKRDDWTGWKTEIDAADTRCKSLIGMINEQAESSRWSSLFAQFQSQSVLIQQLLNAFQAFCGQQRQDRMDEKAIQLLQNLSSDYSAQKDRNPQRVAGTCRWFLEDIRFLQWRDTDASSLLWVSADPGCGKSVLARWLVDERHVCCNITASTLCYFFFKSDGDEGQTAASHAIKAILHNVYENTTEPELIKHAMKDYSSHGDKLVNMFSALWNILLRTAQDDRAGTIVCVLDALDECEPNSRHDLMDALVKLYSANGLSKYSDARIKFLVTSRPYSDIENNLSRLSGNATFVHFDAVGESKHISEDIDRVIDARVPQLRMAGKSLPSDMAKEIAALLRGTEHRTYLWLYLMLNVIQKDLNRRITLNKIKQLFKQIPDPIAEAYKLILDRSSDPESAKIILQSIVAAERPLTVRELNIAFEIAQTDDFTPIKGYEDLDLTEDEDAFIALVRDVCGLFVTLYDSKFYFIHQTAREFLVRQDPGQQVEAGVTRSFAEAEAHLLMAKVCVRYLQFDEFCDDSNESFNAKYDFLRQKFNDNYIYIHLQEIHQFMATYKTHHPLLDYAIHFWSRHVRSCQSTDQQLLVSILDLCDPRIPTCKTWLRFWCESSQRNDLGWSSLGIAAEFGLDAVMKYLLANGEDPNQSAGCLYDRAFSAACARGYASMAQFLITAGAEIDSYPMLIAVYQTDARIIKLLLENGANANKEDEKGNTVLEVACIWNKIEAVKLLLEYGASIRLSVQSYARKYSASISEMLLRHSLECNKSDHTLQDQLWFACIKGRVEDVKRLLRAGALVNHQGEHGRSPLFEACIGNHGEVVSILLNNGAAVDLQNNRGESPLYEASYHGYENVVSQLLKNGAAVDLQNTEGESPLYIASFHGFEKVVSELLKNGASVDLQNHEGDSPLYTASYHGYENIVSQLLKNGAAVDIQNNEGESPLIAVSLAGTDNAEIVCTLLESGATVDLQDEEGNTALLEACVLCEATIVSTLLDNGASVNIYNEHRSSPLLIAASRGSDDIMDLLLKAGADIDAVDSLGCSILSAAFSRKNIPMISALLRKGAGIQVSLSSGESLLHVASREGWDSIVEQLLDVGADINALDCNGNRPIHIGLQNSHKLVTYQLIQRAADISGLDSYGTSALSRASWLGWEGIVATILGIGAEIDLTDNNDGGTALHHASEQGHEAVVAVLLNSGASLTIGNRYYRWTACSRAAYNNQLGILQLMAQHGADFSHSDQWGRTALHYAVMGNRLKVAKYLIQHGAKTEHCDHTGKSLLYFAIRSNSAETVEWVLDHLSDVKVLDEQGWSPLHWAIYFGKATANCAELLLRDGRIDTSLRDNRGWTAMKLTKLTGQIAIEEMLLSYDVEHESIGEEVEFRAIRGFCDSCDNDLRREQHHCTVCPEFDLCWRCFWDVDVLHPGHTFTDSFRYPAPEASKSVSQSEELSSDLEPEGSSSDSE